MTNLILLYSTLSFILIFLSSKISYKLNFIDLPNKRKIHKIATAYTGGITISFIIIFYLLFFDIKDNSLKLILSSSILISIVGLIDDRLNLSAVNKICLQIIPVFYLAVFENMNLSSLGDYKYFELNLGTFKIPFTLLCILFLINSFNYFDGLDGTLIFTSISIIINLNFLVLNENFQLFFVVILIPMSVFLLFNFSVLKLPKMFLGDSGSLLIGFIFSFFLIYLAQQNLVHPILLAWSITIFVYEFLSLNLIRLKNKKNIFITGQDHLHHLIFKLTNSILLTNLSIIILNIIFFTIGYLSFYMVNSLFSLILFIFLFLVFFIFRNFLIIKSS